MEKLGAYALSLVFVPHHQCDFSGVHVAVEAVLADADDRLLLRLVFSLDYGQDHHVSRIVDGDEVLPHLVGDVLSRRDEPGVHALVGEGVEEVLDQGLVADFYGAEEDLLGGTGGPMDGEALGILAALAWDVGLIQVDQLQPLRLLDKPGPEVRMGD